MSSSNAQTAIVYLNNRLNSYLSEQAVEFSAVGLTNTGVFVVDTTTKYISTATSVKDAIKKLDSQLFSVATTYATKSFVDAQVDALIGGAPDTLSTLYQIASSINNEATFSTNLVNSLSAETLRAKNAENTISTSLVTEYERESLAISTLWNNLSTETDRAIAAEISLSTSVISEAARSIAARNVLLANINNQTSLRVANLNTLTTSITDGINSLSTFINNALITEISRATGSESTLSTTLSVEIARATASESTLSTSLATEVARAISADILLSTNLLAETTRAVAAENYLAGRLSTVELNYIRHDGTVPFTGNLNMNTSNRIVNVATPLSNGDLANKQYVDTKLGNLGLVFEYVSSIDVNVLSTLLNLTQQESGDVYRIHNGSNMVITSSNGDGSFNKKFMKAGDLVVRNLAANEWDILNNKDVSIVGTANRLDVTGNLYDEFTFTISPTYVGQASINTMGTISTGQWSASVVQAAYGGTGFSNYVQGDLLVGNSNGSFDRLPRGANNSMLVSNGGNVQWKSVTTDNFVLADNANFSSVSTIQDSTDFLFNEYQLRRVVQHVMQDSTQYADPINYNSNLLSGKANFISYNASNLNIFLPPNSVPLADGTVIRLIHNGDYTDPNMTTYYKDTVGDSNVSIVEIAPHDTMVFIYNSNAASWLVGVGI